MNIKTASKVLPLVVLLTCCRIVLGAGGAPRIGIAIDFHDQNYTDETGQPLLDNDAPRAFFHLVIENTSSKPLLLSRRAIDALYFEVTDESGKTARVDRIPPAKPSAPGFVLLRPGECITMEIHYVVPLLKSGAMMRSAGGRNLGAEGPLDGKYPFPFPLNGDQEFVKVRALLECKTGGDSAAKRGIWTGKAESEPYALFLEGRNNRIDQP